MFCNFIFLIILLLIYVLFVNILNPIFLYKQNFRCSVLAQASYNSNILTSINRLFLLNFKNVSWFSYMSNIDPLPLDLDFHLYSSTPYLVQVNIFCFDFFHFNFSSYFWFIAVAHDSMPITERIHIRSLSSAGFLSYGGAHVFAKF
jgi:hypothetical protein